MTLVKNKNIYKKIANKLQLDEQQVKKVYLAYWDFIKSHI
jgi:hypothetical protein